MSRAAQLERFAASDPTNPVLLCDLLDELLREGRVDDALVRLRSLPSDMRDEPAIKFREARCALVQRDFVAAATILEAMLIATPDSGPGVRHDLALAQSGLGFHDEALRTLAASVVRDDNMTLLAARIQQKKGDYAAAIETLDRIGSGRHHAEAQGLRALLALDSGDTQGGMVFASLALSMDPSQHEALIVAGTVALSGKDRADSLRIFQDVLARHPDSGRAWSGLGQGHLLDGDVASARGALERAAKLMADHVGTWHVLAWTQLLGGDLAAASDSLDRAFALDRTFGETHGGMALVHALRGERKEAADSIRRAARLDPSGRSAQYAQSVLLMDEGRQDEARQIVESLLAKHSGTGVSVSAGFLFRLREAVRPRD